MANPVEVKPGIVSIDVEAPKVVGKAVMPIDVPVDKGIRPTGETQIGQQPSGVRLDMGARPKPVTPSAQERASGPVR
jgi:hypothetical protein